MGLERAAEARAAEPGDDPTGKSDDLRDVQGSMGVTASEIPKAASHTPPCAPLQAPTCASSCAKCQAETSAVPALRMGTGVVQLTCAGKLDNLS
ncbi:hypothetical protein ABZ359_38805 [Streptomyces sp. NPDC005968]|uniref:hypothetical protein n=1 Tax=Streptomyces sp. NPDC005968 TaxID=3154574 RepID=UPI0033EDA34F